MEANKSFKIYWNLHKADTEATKTFDILWDLHQQTCNCYAPKTKLSDFFENKVVLWSLCKYIFGKADVHPLALNMNALYINARERSKLFPSEVISSHTHKVHHRLTEYMLSNNTDSYQKLLVEEEKNLDKMTQALMAIYFGKWDYLPDLAEEIKNPANAKLLVRMFARHTNPSAKNDRRFWHSTNGLETFLLCQVHLFCRWCIQQ